MNCCRTLVTAHAGCLGTVPNSLANVDAALASRADIVEVDMRTTRDGVVILAHDEGTVLPDGRRARFSELEWDLVRKLPSPDSTGYLRLDDLLDRVRGLDRVLNLDAKEIGAMVIASRLLSGRGMATDAIFSGLDLAGIGAASSGLPGFRYLFNADALISEGGGQTEIAEVCGLASAWGACGINLEWTKASASLVDFARRRSLPVHLWTVDEPGDMVSVLRFGPFSITTNRPDMLTGLVRDGFQGE